MAGYSKKTLIDKLGLKEGARALLVAAPAGYDEVLGALPKGVAPKRAALAKLPPGSGAFDFIQCFCRTDRDLKGAIPALKKSLDRAGMLWISWPKKTALSKEEAKDPDLLDESKVRALGLKSGLVDVKVCAVDEKWSGLKFMYRLADR